MGKALYRELGIAKASPWWKDCGGENIRACVNDCLATRPSIVLYLANGGDDRISQKVIKMINENMTREAPAREVLSKYTVLKVEAYVNRKL